MDVVQLELHPPAATLWLNRPQAANAINLAMARQLAARVTQLESRDDLRVIFVRGRGGKFCAGADLNELTAGQTAGDAELELELARTLDRLAALPLVVIGVLERFAFGGGFLIAMYCDLRVATAGTQLGFTRLAGHWMPPWGLSRIAGWIGVARAQQLLVAQGYLNADRAGQIGLVDHVAPEAELDSLLSNLADEYASTRRDVIRELKTFFSQLGGLPHAEWDRVSASGFARTFAHPEAQAAISEFLNEKSKRVEKQE